MFHLTPTSLFTNFCGARIDGAVRQRAELVAGGRKVRDHIRIIDRQRFHRLDDHSGLRRHEVIDPVSICIRIHVQGRNVEAIKSRRPDQL